jgi:microcystin-dependent protein
MTSALRYINNIDTSFPKPGQDNPSQGFRSNFANIQQALNNLNSYMDGLAATTFNIVAPSITATQTLTVFDKLIIGNTNSVYVSVIGYNDLVVTGKNSDGSSGAGSIPLFLNVIAVGRISYGTDVNYGSYFVSNTAINKILVGATFTNLLLTKFTVTRIDIEKSRLYYTPDSSNNLPATVNITNPPLGNSVAALQNTLNLFLPIGSIILWYGAVGTIPAGWNLCDGTILTLPNGVQYPIPDLRDRFVVGAGQNYNAGSVGGSKDAIVPFHSHAITDPGHYHLAGADDLVGASVNGDQNTKEGVYDYPGSPTNNTVITSTVGTGITINSTGTNAVNANLPPYYALCYIMKIA